MTAINNKTTVFDAGEVFGGRKSGRPVVGFMEPNPYVPDEDIRYVMPQWAGAIAFWFAHVKDPLFVFGPTGCGKTSAVKQLARRINYPVYETTGHNRMEFSELVGHHAVIDGNMRFEYGPLTQAMKYGGIFLLNEVDLLSPDAMAGMNSILDGSPLCIAENGGEVVKPHPLFRFVATANSNGTGDETGLYQGVLRMNAAAADRFFMVKADYMAESSELAMLRKACPQLSDEEVAQLTSFAQAVRKLFAGDGDDTHVAQLSITMSTRTLLRWGLFMQVLKESAGNVNYNFCKQALNHTFAYKASSSDRVAIDEIYQRIFG